MFPVQFIFGPGADITITESLAKARGWHNMVFTTQQRVFPRLPVPNEREVVLVVDNEEKLIQEVKDVHGLEVRVTRL